MKGSEIVKQQEEIKNLNVLQRWQRVMQAVEYHQKERVSGLKYSIVQFTEVLEKIRPYLLQYNLVLLPYIQSVNSSTETITMKDGNKPLHKTVIHGGYRVVATDTEALFQIEGSATGISIGYEDKDASKAMTACLKNALLKGLCLITGDDSEEEYRENKEADENGVIAEIPSKVTDEQAKEIWQLCKKKGVNIETILTAHQVESALHLTIKDYEMIKSRLEKRPDASN